MEDREAECLCIMEILEVEHSWRTGRWSAHGGSEGGAPKDYEGPGVGVLTEDLQEVA